MDDICDAFIIARYVRFFLDDLINKTKQPYIFEDGIITRRRRGVSFKITFNNLIDPPNHKRTIVNPNKAPRKATKKNKKKPKFIQKRFYKR
jgi:hypothetical protein